MSHFTVLVSVAPPACTDTIVVYSEEEKAELASLRALQKPGFTEEMRLKGLLSKLSPFGCEIENAVAGILAPYDENTEEPDYLEFVETETRYRAEYEMGGCYANQNAGWGALF